MTLPALPAEPDASAPAFRLARTAAARAFAEERALGWTALANLALAVAFLALMPLDGRTILGVDPWLKPFKFAVSIGVFCATAALLLLPLREGRAKSFVRWGIALPLAGEMLIIAAQSARGVPSHFNEGTALDATLYRTMGGLIALVTVATLVLLVLHLRHRGLPPALAWGIRAGIAISLVGSAVGGIMVGAERHTVGGEDGGPGMAVTNWSTEHGDLRVAHFAGLHAIQALPLLGLALARSAMSPRAGAALVLAAAAAYAFAVGGLHAWALLDRPVLG